MIRITTTWFSIRKKRPRIESRLLLEPRDGSTRRSGNAYARSRRARKDLRTSTAARCRGSALRLALVGRQRRGDEPPPGWLRQFSQRQSPFPRDADVDDPAHRRVAVIEYLARRILALLPVALGVATLTFAIIHLVPGDPIVAMLGESAAPADVVAMRHQMGLDRPILTQ